MYPGIVIGGVPRGESARERRFRRDQADDAENAACRLDVGDLRAEAAGAAIDQHDAACELTRSVRIATGCSAQAVAFAGVLFGYSTAPSIAAVCGADQGWNTAKRGPGAAGARMSISRSVEVGTSVCATLSAVDAAAGEPVMNCLSALLPADATVNTPDLSRRIDRGGQIVIERLAVSRTQRHVDDVDVIGGGAITVRIHATIPSTGSVRCRCRKSRARSTP